MGLPLADVPLGMLHRPRKGGEQLVAVLGRRTVVYT